MNILALDPAQRTGWAWSDGSALAHGVWLLGSHPAGRLERLASYIRLTVARHPTEAIAFELATFGSRFAHTMRRHNELAGAIQLTAAQLGLPCWGFPPPQWKARALGHGGADKSEVRRRLQLLYGLDVVDSDVADAIGILKAAEQGPPPETHLQTKRRRRLAARRLPRLF